MRQTQTADGSGWGLGRAWNATGFTLVELLVVLFISVGLLLALVIPAVSGFTGIRRRLQCLGNLNQIGIGIHNYSSTYGCFPLGNSTTGRFLVVYFPLKH